MNVDCPDVNLGKTLTEFKEFSADFDPTMKGLAMSNSEELRATHNSFARQSVFEFDAKFAKEDDDVFHFGKTYIMDLSYALPFYRSQNVLCWSNFFEPAQKFDCIKCLFKNFCAGTKTNFTEYKSSFCLAQNVFDCRDM
jgi:hypothetical protein